MKDCVMIHITVPDFSYNQYFCTFFIVHEVVCSHTKHSYFQTGLMDVLNRFSFFNRFAKKMMQETEAKLVLHCVAKTKLV